MQASPELLARSTLAPMTIEMMLALVGAAVATIATAVTAWMAVETRRMAVAASAALELERAPILGFRDLRVEIGARQANEGETGSPPQMEAVSVRVGVELYNAGRVPVRYRMRSIRLTFGGRTTDAATFLSRGGRILPAASIVFWHPSMTLDPPISAFPSTGRVQFEFEYSDESGLKPQLIVETVEYTVSGAAPGSCVNWLHIDEAQLPNNAMEPVVP